MNKLRYYTNKVHNYLAYLFRRIFGYPVLYNVFEVDERVSKKRALLVYLVEPFRKDATDINFKKHQNLSQVNDIASVIHKF